MALAHWAVWPLAGLSTWFRPRDSPAPAICDLQQLSWSFTPVAFLPPASSCPPARSHPPVLQAKYDRALSSECQEQNEYSLSWGEKVFSITWSVMITLRMNGWRWTSKDLSKIGQLRWRNGRKLELSLWEFSTKVSNGLNSNQAQDTWFSIWVVHQRTKRKEIRAWSRIWPESFQVIPFSMETISSVCACSGTHSPFGAWFALNSGHSSCDQYFF